MQVKQARAVRCEDEAGNVGMISGLGLCVCVRTDMACSGGSHTVLCLSPLVYFLGLFHKSFKQPPSALIGS